MKLSRGTALATAIAATLAFAPAASAEIVGTEGGFTYVKKEKTLPAAAPLSADGAAKCPGDMTRVGGGASVTGTASGTTLATSGTSADNQWNAEAWHTGLNPQDETLTIWAICTPKINKVSDVHNLESVGSGSGNATVECAEGHATGGGVRTIGGADDWWLNSTFPIDLGSDPDLTADDGWRSFVEHLVSETGDFIIDGVCMKGAIPTYKNKSTQSGDVEAVTRKAKCPKDESVTGGGAFASGDSDDAHVVTTAPYDSKKDKDKVPDDGWKATLFNDNGVGQSFSATTICK